MKPRLIKQVATPELIAPSSAREERTQSVHRLQIGLFGLAAMLLLVGLANIIMDRARLADDQSGIPEISATPAKKAITDPLADIGVVPAADPTLANTSAAKP